MADYWDVDGNRVRRGPDRPRTQHRVTFGRATTDHEATAGGVYINARSVRADGQPVGTLYGDDAAMGNPHRPTRFEFVSVDGDRFRSDRLESARTDILHWWEARRGNAH